MASWFRTLLVAFALTAFACAPPGPTLQTPTAAVSIGSAAPLPVSPTPTTEPGPTLKGLAARDSDARIVALAQAALDCPWGDHDFRPGCKAYNDWLRARNGFDDGAADRTLVNFLEDSDERVRWLGTRKLASHGPTFAPDKELASRLIAASENEKEPKLAQWMGMRLATIDFEKAHVVERVAAMIHDPNLGEVRCTVLVNMLRANQDNDAVVRLAMDMIHDPDLETRRAALLAFKRYSGKGQTQGCQFLLGSADDADDAVASLAVSVLTENAVASLCPDSLEGIVGAIEKRVAAGATNENDVWAYSLKYVCGGDIMAGGSKLTDAQKIRARALAATLAAPGTKGAHLRGAALDAILQCDPKNGKAHVAKYRHDKEDYVRRHAEELLSPAPSPPFRGRTEQIQ